MELKLYADENGTQNKDTILHLPTKTLHLMYV